MIKRISTKMKTSPHELILTTIRKSLIITVNMVMMKIMMQVYEYENSDQSLANENSLS